MSLLFNQIYVYIYINTCVSQKFCSILVQACLLCVNHMTEAVQTMGGPCYDW